GLPKPSYTIDTMTYLHEKYQQHTFSLIMGSDNLATIDQWKNYEVLLQRYVIHIYKRSGAKPIEAQKIKADIRAYDMPYLDISSTFIRQSLKEGKSIRYLVPEKVFEYLEGSSMYRQ
ncbi:MAG TPA: hypothetical protein VJ508_17830, partial [Saprospiraceae bacterium]|nr:hypothetical protein [Saprospiraceae bacterium]